MLETLRAKPDHVKKSIALTATTAIFSIVLLVWWSSWDARTTEEVSRGKAVSPLAGISSVLQGITTDLKTTYSSATSFEEDMGASITGSTIVKASSSEPFDTSSVVIIDASLSGTSTSSVATTTTQ